MNILWEIFGTLVFLLFVLGLFLWDVDHDNIWTKKKQMEIGMLWTFSEDKKKEYDIVEEIHKAYTYYNQKYSPMADTCVVSPDTQKMERVLDFDGNKVNIIRDSLIASKCLWIGNENAKEILRNENV